MLHKLGDGFLASPDAFMIDPITLTDVLGAHQSERAEQVQFIINHRVNLPYAVAWRNDRKWGGSCRATFRPDTYRAAIRWVASSHGPGMWNSVGISA
ncbi:hypothetical protein U1839_08280 [Sphingomonas sp. RT2P30]|uniref:hypothetical protein n=1 Tax=Parasphingomonas halimpatiens TaxID=3096162 RepID=UPI002FCABAEF